MTALLNIRRRSAEAAEGDRGIEIAPLEIDRVAQGVGDFLEGRAQSALERGAAILLHRLARHKEGDDLPLRDFDIRKIRDRLRIIEPEANLVVLDGKTEAVAHEIDVALDGLGGNLELGSQLAAIGVNPRLDALMQAHHALQRRAGVTAG